MFKQTLRLLPTGFVLEFNVAKMSCVSNRFLLFVNKNYLAEKQIKKPNLLYLNCRSYAKSCNIKKEKQKKIKFDENELQEYFDVEKLLSDLNKPLEHFKEEIIKHGTLRSSSNAIENIKIKIEGNTYTIQDLAKIGKKNANLYVLDFTSFPSAITAVVNTLQKSELNVNPQKEGNRVYVPIPKVTKEYREVLLKKIKLYFFKCKDAIRNVQMKYTKSLLNIDKLASEKKSRITQQLTALGNQKILLAEEILKKKHEELLKEHTS